MSEQKFLVQQWGYVPELRMAKLKEEAVLPVRKHVIDAGIDFFACGDYIIKPHTNKIIHTGITVEIPVGYFMLFKPKGGSNWLVGAGVADAGYQGEILFKIYNTFDREFVIRHGDAVGQAVLLPVSIAKVTEISLDEIHPEESERKDSGGIISDIDTEK